MTRSKWEKLLRCKRKVKHRYFIDATEEFLRMKRTHRGDFLNIYHCRVCKCWHIGNYISLENAKKSLAALEKKMARDEFRRQAPLPVQTEWKDRRLSLINYIMQKEKP